MGGVLLALAEFGINTLLGRIFLLIFSLAFIVFTAPLYNAIFVPVPILASQASAPPQPRIIVTFTQQIAPQRRRRPAYRPALRCRCAIAANPTMRIQAPPSVSADEIWRALWAAGSPLANGNLREQGKTPAEYIWDEGRVLRIDPAILMAIYNHESNYGTRGIARLTRSIGNIRPLNGQPSVDGYRLYGTWWAAVDDCYRLLGEYARHGLATMSDAVPVWAPPSDSNDDAAYLASIAQTTGNLYANSRKE